MLTMRNWFLIPALLAVANCREEPGSHVQANSAAEPTATQVRLALLPPSRESDLAALEGRLRVDGPCLYVGNATPAWLIEGIRWNEATGRLEAQGKSFAAGDLVVLGGGGAGGDPAKLPWVQPPDPSCDMSELFIAGSIDPGPYRSAAEREAGKGARHNPSPGR
jgi:hypothetical protein